MPENKAPIKPQTQLPVSTPSPTRTIEKPHFLLSAQNPKHPESNRAKFTHEQLITHLKSNGYDAHSVDGHYGAPEKSALVYNVKPEHAENLHALASRLGQDSSIYSNGTHHEMRFHHGADKGKSHYGQGTQWHKEKPDDFYTTLPNGRHFTHHFNFDEKNPSGKLSKPLKRSETMGKAEKIGVHEEYKENAHKQCDILFRVKVMGRSILVDDIPLHMSLKCFNNKNEYDLDEVKALVKELDITKPDLKNVKFKPIIFTNERTKNKYYMLILENINGKYKKFCDAFKGVGVTHKKFMGHITIDKDLYDKIKKDGITAEELEFGPLMVEHGAGNDIHTFNKSEELEKGAIKNFGAMVGLAGALTGGTPAKQTPQAATNAPTVTQAQTPSPAYSRKKMLNTISQVESNGGKNMHHKELGGMHAGESAYGKFGLTPAIIRETIHMNPDLNHKYKKATALRGDDLQRFMQDNPGLEDTIADKHLARLEHHFGQDPSSLGYAWLNGVRGTYKAKKENKDIASHWHAKKITDAYSRGM